MWTYRRKRHLFLLISVGILCGLFTNARGMFCGCCTNKKKVENVTFSGEPVTFLSGQAVMPRRVDNSFFVESIFLNTEPLFSPLANNNKENVGSAGMTPIFMNLELSPIPLRKQFNLIVDEKIFETPKSSFLFAEEYDLNAIIFRAHFCYNRSMQYLYQYGFKNSIVDAFCVLHEYCDIVAQQKGFNGFDNDLDVQIFKETNLLKEAIYSNYCKLLSQVKLEISDCIQSMESEQKNAQINKFFFNRIKKIEGGVLLLCQCYDKIFVYDNSHGLDALNEIITAYNLLRERFITLKREW